MRPHKLILFIFLLGQLSFLQAQQEYEIVDKYAVSIGYPDSVSLNELTLRLTDRIPDPALKARAIYAWIAHHIAYDCPAYHSLGRRKNSPEEVYMSKRAVSAGYANLFMEMCSYAKVQCLVIDGYSRNSWDVTGETMEEPNHNWNAVRIDGDWKLIDVTLASGYTDEKVKTFTKAYSDIFFFPDPTCFLLSHYPKLAAWKLTKSRSSLNDYFEGPIVLPQSLQFGVKAADPEKGLIKRKEGESFTLSVSLDAIEKLDSVKMVIGERKYQKTLTPDPEISGKTLRVKAKFDIPGKHPVILYINGAAVVKYDLEIL